MVGFMQRGFDGTGTSAEFSREVADFKFRMESLGNGEHPEFAVIDFSNYCITDWDNGRTIVSLVLSAHQRLKAQGGGLLICNHPAQFNPDQQGFFHLDKLIDIYRSRQEAIEAARSRRHQLEAS